MSDQHNVFISHRHEDDELIGRLKDALSRSNVNVRDSSVTSEIPNNAKAEGYIKQLLADRINWSGKMIVIISPETHSHAWVDWEIEYANRKDKRIIGVWAPGADGSDLPMGLEDYADAIVPWDAAKIIRAIDGEDNWQTPDGTDASPRTIKRLSC